MHVVLQIGRWEQAVRVPSADGSALPQFLQSLLVVSHKGQRTGLLFQNFYEKPEAQRSMTTVRLMDDGSAGSSGVKPAARHDA